MRGNREFSSLFVLFILYVKETSRNRSSYANGKSPATEVYSLRKKLMVGHDWCSSFACISKHILILNYFGLFGKFGR